MQVSSDRAAARPKAQDSTNIEQRRSDIMSRVRFEPMTPMFEGEKAVYALDGVTTVIGTASLYSGKMIASN
jgi:hypothetical protein